MAKYKVGDTVKIRKDLKAGSYYNGTLFSISMEKYKGRTAKITKSSRDINDYIYKTNIDNGEHWWSANMFECYEKYEIIRDGSTVIVTDGERKGVAKCNPIDEFDLATGIKLAMKRMEKDLPQESDKYWVIDFSL